MTTELKIRKCARAIVVNDANEVLMIKHCDKTAANPLNPDVLEYWVPPGGKVEEEETFQDAAIRELMEETGIVINSVSECILQQSRELYFEQTFGSSLMRTDERFFLSKIRGNPKIPFFDLSEGIVDARWWPIANMEKSEEIFFPEGLNILLRNVLKF
ncbi:MAG TPA: NUDIX hydrolase [Candidatus Kapabacteria bacterium]|jgi:8-oxo-dGTP pyrophosphatase MutT (NUDIX family)